MNLNLQFIVCHRLYLQLLYIYFSVLKITFELQITRDNFQVTWQNPENTETVLFITCSVFYKLMADPINRGFNQEKNNTTIASTLSKTRQLFIRLFTMPWWVDSYHRWEIQTPCLLLWLQGRLSQATIPVTTTNCVSYTDHSVCASLPQKIHSMWCEKGKATVVDLFPTTPSFIILLSL